MAERRKAKLRGRKFREEVDDAREVQISRSLIDLRFGTRWMPVVSAILNQAAKLFNAPDHVIDKIGLVDHDYLLLRRILELV